MRQANVGDYRRGEEMSMINKHRSFFIFLLVFLVYVAITAFIWRYRLAHLSSCYGMPGVDTDGTLWHGWSTIYAKSRLINYDFTNLFVSFPFGYDFSYIPYFSLISTINIMVVNFLGLSWVHLITTYNISSLLAYPLSAIAAYSLCYYLTKNAWAGFISGLIFGFSYYFTLMGRATLAQNHLELIPLYFLSLFYYLDSKTGKALIISCLAFALMFMANAYWAFFSGIFSVIVMLIYKKHGFKKACMGCAKYYAALIIFTLLINLNFVLSNLYSFNSSSLNHIGKVFIPENQVFKPLSFFVPSQFNFLYPFLKGFGHNFMGYAALLAGISGLFFLKTNRRLYLLLASCFLFSILLAANIPGLFWINQIYFHFFGMFRSVSRFNLFSSLFLSLMAGMVVASLYDKLAERIVTMRKRVLYAVLFLVFSVWIIFEGLTVDPTWYSLTDFSQIARLNAPLRDDPEIHAIAAYPMNLSNVTSGFPPNYQLLGQIVHNKPLAGGASPFMENAIEYNSKISDLSNLETIDTLAKYGVNGIVIYNRLLPNSGYINKTLKADKRLVFLGRVTAPHSPGIDSSALDSTQDISVFKIKTANLKFAGMPELGMVKSDTIYEKNSGHRLRVFIPKLAVSDDLYFKQPFSRNWNLYIEKIEPIICDTGKEVLYEWSEKATEVKECRSAKIKYFWEDLLFLLKSPDFKATHEIFNEFGNSWTINPEYIRKKYTGRYYADNPDGSIGVELILFYKPAAYAVLGRVISGITLICSIFYVFYMSVKRKNTAPRIVRPI